MSSASGVPIAALSTSSSAAIASNNRPTALFASINMFDPCPFASWGGALRPFADG
jgi:hypothetical protein